MRKTPQLHSTQINPNKKAEYSDPVSFEQLTIPPFFYFRMHYVHVQTRVSSIWILSDSIAMNSEFVGLLRSMEIV